MHPTQSSANAIMVVPCFIGSTGNLVIVPFRFLARIVGVFGVHCEI